MSMLFMISGEWGNNKEFDLIGGSVSADATQKRTGSYALYTGNGNYGYKNISPAATELYMQFAWRAQLPGQDPFFSFRKNGTDLISLNRNALGLLEVRSGWKGSTLYLTGITPISANTWYVIEVHYKIADAGGLIELRVDGNLEGVFSGDSKPDANADIDQVRWGCTTGWGFWVDDIVCNDTNSTVNNSWPNGLKLYLLKPAGDAGPNEWTATPGPTHYTGVDEVPPSGTDFVKIDQNDKVELFALADLPAEAQSVKAVALDFWGFKGSTIAPTRVAQMANIGGTNYVQADQDLPMAQELVRKILEQNPAGGNWSVASVNALVSGAKSRP